MANGYVILPPDANNTGQKSQVFNNTVANTAVVATGVAIVTSAGVSCDLPSGTGVAVAGTVNSNSADSGSPVKVGGVYNSTLPVASSGARLDIQLDVNGKQLVTSNADGPVSAGTAASKSFLVGGVYNSALPSPTNGQQVAIQLNAGGCVLAAVTTNADGPVGAGSAASKSFLVGGVYNTSLPSPSNGQQVAVQLNAAGCVLAAVTTNADGPVSAGSAASKSLLTGAVYNSSAPGPSSGQQVALQVDAVGDLMVGIGATLKNNATKPTAGSPTQNLNGTKVVYKASAGTLYGFVVENNQGATTYVQLFDALTGSVSLGTTKPDLEFMVAANTMYSPNLPACGWPFGTGLVAAATTSSGGSSGSSNGVSVFPVWA